MDWVSVVPLWFWIVLAVGYGLAGTGWGVALLNHHPNDVWACRFYGAAWPLTSLVALIGTALDVHRKRVNRRKAGWGR